MTNDSSETFSDRLTEDLPINVVLISHSPHLCGAERMLINLAISLATTTRYRPIVLIPNARLGPLPKLLEPHGIEWHDTPTLSWFLWANVASTSDFLGRAAEGAARYESILKRVGADLVVVNTLVYVEGVIAAMRCDLPFVLWVHGILDAGMLGRADYLAEVVAGLPLKLSRHVVCCSHWTRRFFEHKTEPGKIETIHNWTQVPAAPTPRAGQVRFAALSTLETHKGIDVLIKAVAILASRGVGLDLYGDGADKERFQALARRLGLADRIAFHGRVVDVEKVYDSSIAILFPSFVEPFGMVAIESMARGTPVIASRVGGLCEIIEDGVSGLLFKAGDVNALAACMVRVLDEPGLSAKLGSGGYERARSLFDGADALRRFERVFDRVLSSFSAYPQEERDLLDVLELGMKTGREKQDADWNVGLDPTPIPSDDRPITPALPAGYQTAWQWDLEAAGSSVLGHLDDLCDGRYLTGWADLPGRGEPCLLEAYVDGDFAGRFRADLDRPDLAVLELADCRRGFAYPVPAIYLDGSTHVFEVRLAASAIALQGSPAAYATILAQVPVSSRSSFDGLFCGSEARGWATISDGMEHCELDLYVDGGFCRRFHADEERSDLAPAGFPDGRGFRVALPDFLLDDEDHLVEIRFASSGIQIEGSPRTERVARRREEERADLADALPASDPAGWAAHLFQKPRKRWPTPKHEWRTGRNADRTPFVVAVADALIPSTEILLAQPLAELKVTNGIDFKILMDDDNLDESVVARADVLLLLRLTTDRAMKMVEHARMRGTPIVYMIDDDLSLLGEEVGLTANESRSRQRNIHAMMRASRRVVVTNEVLRDEVGAAIPCVETIPAASDVEFFDAMRRSSQLKPTEELRIGYAGTATHGMDAAMVEPALLKILQDHPHAVVESIGQPLASLSGHGRYRFFPFVDGIRPFARFLYSRQWTVALAPLVATRFNEAKSDNKYRVHAAAGIAGVYSKIAPYGAIQDGVNGLVVEDDRADSWFNAIDCLLKNRALREQLANNALKDVRQKYSLPSVSGKLYQILRSVKSIPTVLFVGDMGAASSCLRSVDQNGGVFLRISDYVNLSEREIEWADVVVFRISRRQNYHPMLSYIRENSCRIIAIYDKSGNEADSSTQIPQQNFIIERSDVLVLNTGELDRAAWTVFSASVADKRNWVSSLESLTDGSWPELCLSRLTFVEENKDAGMAEMSAYEHAFKILGIDIGKTLSEALRGNHESEYL